ncbi:MAG: hypothetical protein JNK82_05310 [Myxococcaceae bacterium]|nr:hypothetical protein [Myxococcaceae bacterium]
MLLALLLTLCPAPEAVEHKLSTLRGPNAAAPKYQLEVGTLGESVLLTARDLNGALWLQRELPASAPCGELEDAAAVVLLAWEAQLAPGEVPVPEVMRIEPVVVAPVEPEPPAPLTVRVNAGGQVWLSSAMPTWGAAGSVEVHGRWLGFEVGVLGQGRRTVPLGPGSAVWSRASMWVGPMVTAQVARGVDASLTVGFVGGMFQATSAGFDVTTPVTDFDLGGLASAKVLLPGFWKLRPYVALMGAWWARRHLVESTSPEAARVLPFLEASPSVGLAFVP